MGNSFSDQIKKSNTDEWYTLRESVEVIVPYLNRGGTSASYAHLIRQKAIS